MIRPNRQTLVMHRITAKRVGERLWVAVDTLSGRCVLGLTRDMALAIMKKRLARQLGR